MNMDKESLRKELYRLFTDLRIELNHQKPGDVYGQYADAIMELFDTYSKQAETRAALRGYACESDEEFRLLCGQFPSTKGSK